MASACEEELAFENFKRYKPQGTAQIPAELNESGLTAVFSNIHKTLFFIK
jgi:hypothetical protein